eukprot:CAMPEP_0197442968 /NCGR_PEP_ID=MMETSP1175-20131217/8850_1 /TAXON_ID=1003142 /ORGANISM="Triceratium dubium, Strain CCMP147" /LENGTH=339 /DNA_ID=CAMNT_0042973541 /DNA_START=32 /DNA_END=1047 /DNA_ORIENTATION=-
MTSALSSGIASARGPLSEEKTFPDAAASVGTEAERMKMRRNGCGDRRLRSNDTADSSGSGVRSARAVRAKPLRSSSVRAPSVLAASAALLILGVSLGWTRLLPAALAQPTDEECHLCPPGFSFQQNAEACSKPLGFAPSPEECESVKTALLANPLEFPALSSLCGYCVPNKPKKIIPIIKQRKVCTLCKNGKAPRNDAGTALTIDGVEDKTCGELANRLIAANAVGDGTCGPMQEAAAETCGCGPPKAGGGGGGGNGGGDGGGGDRVAVDANGQCPEGKTVCKKKPKWCCDGKGDGPEDCPVVPKHTDNIFADSRRDLQQKRKKRGGGGGGKRKGGGGG